MARSEILKIIDSYAETLQYNCCDVTIILIICSLLFPISRVVRFRKKKKPLDVDSFDELEK